MRSKISVFITSQVLIMLVGMGVFSCKGQKRQKTIEKGMVITKSTSILPGAYLLESGDLTDPILTISGDNIVVDFNGAVLNGTTDPLQPDLFEGLGIHVEKGKNIQIKNVVVKGFRVGLLGREVDSLQILSSNFSYNHRERLKSTPDIEDLDDWLTHFEEDMKTWPRKISGTGIYLSVCDNALVKDVVVNEGQNGLVLTNCKNGHFYNNNMQFNSGVGIGLYASSGNQIMHNKLDWCIRGYSHGNYNRGQNSAGILLADFSFKNTIAYNSVTHAGDGFSVWYSDNYAKIQERPTEHNMIYGNDFSHASNNGVKATFIPNIIINNKIEDCQYGIWGGYSYESIFAGNRMKGNIHDIAIEHGHKQKIFRNRMENSDIGIQLWERPVQPKGWTFLNERNIKSSDYEIKNNVFTKVKEPLKIEDTKTIDILENQFAGFQRLLKSSPSNDSLNFFDNKIYQNDLLGDAYPFRNDNEILNGISFDLNTPVSIEKELKKVAPFSDGQKTNLPVHVLRGRKYMLITEWGPYNFKYPTIWLRGSEGDQYTFALFGPEGNWKVVGGNGFTSFSRKTGAMPATLVATKGGANKPVLRIDLEFIGTGFKDQFGNEFEKGRGYPFQFLLD